MQRLRQLLERIERSIRLITTTHGAFLRMRDLKPPYPLFVKGRKALINTEDSDESRGIYAEVVLRDGYGVRSIAETEKPQRIADIGANVGTFAVLAALHFPDAVIHAFDPHPVAYTWLTKNIPGHKIEAFNQAVADRSGELRFDVKAHATLSALSQSGTHIVQAIAPMEIFPDQEIDLLKLDCEGAEFLILKDPALLKRTKRLTMEYHLDQENSFDTLKRLLEQGGHRITKLTKSELAPDQFGILWSERAS